MHVVVDLNNNIRSTIHSKRLYLINQTFKAHKRSLKKLDHSGHLLRNVYYQKIIGEHALTFLDKSCHQYTQLELACSRLAPNDPCITITLHLRS